MSIFRSIRRVVKRAAPLIRQVAPLALSLFGPVGMAAAAAINASRGGSQPPIEQILSPPEPMTASPFFPTIIAAAGRVILPAAVGSIFSGPGDEEDDFDDDDFDDDDSDGYYEE